MPIGNPLYFQQLQQLYISKDKLVRKNIQDYSTTKNNGLSIDDLSVDINEFLNSPFGLHSTVQEWESKTVLNHMGYVMLEHMLTFFHDFRTLMPKKRHTYCGICDSINHNACGCTMVCPVRS